MIESGWDVKAMHAVYVLHVFQKNARKTPKQDLTRHASDFVPCSKGNGERMARKSNRRPYQRTSNVFRDLGFSAEEAAHLLVRSALMTEVQTLLNHAG
jgi:hypothetical protein